MTTRPKPDPARGVFTTMLVIDGTPVAPAEHLARLAASMEAVYGAPLPAGTADRVEESANGLELGRLRLTFAPGGEGLDVEATELDRAFHFPAQPVSLVAHQVSGGLGAHKWVDRAALPAAEPGEAPLLVDGAEVLEAAWANVFAVRSGALFTPPLDGRILPGVTRAAIAELGRREGIEVSEEALTVAELKEADEVFLTNSTRGIELVEAVDEVRLPRERPLSHRLAATLQGAWNLETKDGRPKAAVFHT